MLAMHHEQHRIKQILLGCLFTRSMAYLTVVSLQRLNRTCRLHNLSGILVSWTFPVLDPYLKMILQSLGTGRHCQEQCPWKGPHNRKPGLCREVHGQVPAPTRMPALAPWRQHYQIHHHRCLRLLAVFLTRPRLCAATSHASVHPVSLLPLACMLLIWVQEHQVALAAAPRSLPMSLVTWLPASSLHMKGCRVCLALKILSRLPLHHLHSHWLPPSSSKDMAMALYTVRTLHVSLQFC
jgi:hypothetical protein